MAINNAPVTLAGARLVDPRAGTVSEPTDVHVRAGRIVQIGGQSPDAAAAAVQELEGRFLAPGLVSVHSHLSVRYPFSATDEAESVQNAAIMAKRL